MTTLTKKEIEIRLAKRMAGFSKDPVGWVKYSFTWGIGELEKFKGPEDWQLKVLDDLKNGLISFTQAILIATESGHGVGKSALVSWLILWAISTKANTRGIVTANTENQLATKTWPELAKWHRLFVASHWFEYTATSIYAKEAKYQKTWRIDMVPWSKEKPEAFAGLHNKGGRILIIFDEASSIPDVIWEVTDGATTDSDTEIIWAAFGNPTRAAGRFQQCFGKLRHRWLNYRVDSRDVSITNKEQIKQWIEDYGLESDFVRVRVRGLPPMSSELQFIPTNIVEAAKGRNVKEEKYNFAPKIIGVDPAWSGNDELVIYLRQGLYSTMLGKFMKVEDDMLIAGFIAKWEVEHQVDAVFIDLGYGTGIYSAGKLMNREWTLVSFAAESNDPGFLNKRAQMWNDVKTWLKQGGCLPDDQVICDELCGPFGVPMLNGKIKLESKEDMKKRGLSSPNRADALALTFAYPVVKKTAYKQKLEFANNQDYDPLK